MNLTDQFSEEFLIRFFNGQLNKDEINKLKEWIESSDKNLSEFETYRKIWLATAIHLDNEKIDPEAGWVKIAGHLSAARSDTSSPIFSLVKNRRLSKILGIAAMVVFLISLGSISSWLIFAPKKVQNTHNLSQVFVPLGSKSQLILPDGTTAWINAGSKLSYASDYNLTERVVTLEGEGYFDVRSNKKKPFIVQTSHLKIKAYGTVFNVKAYPEEQTITTTLIEGNVEIQLKGTSNRAHSFRLKPHQNIVYHINTGTSEIKHEKESGKEIQDNRKNEKSNPEIQIIDNIKSELYTSWKDEKWVLEGITLNELAHLLERRYGTRIEILNERLNTYKFSGTIQNETLEQVLVILRLTTPLEYHVGKGYITWNLDKELEKDYSRLIKR